MKRLILGILILCMPLGARAQNVDALLSAVTTATTSAPVSVASWPNSAVQVVVGTCTGSYALKFQGTIDGTTWDDIELSGGSATITQATIGASATDTFAIPAGYKLVRAAAGTVTNCTLSAYLSRNP